VPGEARPVDSRGALTHANAHTLGSARAVPRAPVEFLFKSSQAFLCLRRCGHLSSSGHLMMQNSLPNGSCITAHSNIASPSMMYMSGGLMTAPPISTIA